jgi:hypothetical protein
MTLKNAALKYALPTLMLLTAFKSNSAQAQKNHSYNKSGTTVDSAELKPGGEFEVEYDADVGAPVVNRQAVVKGKDNVIKDGKFQKSEITSIDLYLKTGHHISRLVFNKLPTGSNHVWQLDISSAMDKHPVGPLNYEEYNEKDWSTKLTEQEKHNIGTDGLADADPDVILAVAFFMPSEKPQLKL